MNPTINTTMNLPTHKPKECVWIYPLDVTKTPIVLIRAMKDILDDLAFTHVGHWRPFEATLYLPATFANHPQMPKAIQELTPWMRERQYAWVVLRGGTVCQLKVSGKQIV